MSELSESSPRKEIESLEGGFVCLVDGDGEYNLSEEKLKELISYVDPKNTQDYSIVGIMGCQSSGKSTLLNRLFNTKFLMMDSDRGRQQTTKGIWLDAARNTNNLVIMDLEGTDSGERGEDRTTFERQTILYGLALCEVLIVNMWENDIGRYTASNYGVLKTVFEVNLQLFKKQSKTMLLFIIRDHIEQVTPFSKIIVKLTEDVQRIWDELRKPEDYEGATVFDCFDFRFEALPHKVLMADAFEQEATLLSQKFTDPQHQEFFFNTEYHGAKSVPAEGFAKYSHGIWETIRSNQDLNLPSQKEMLATFRCDELSSQALAKCLIDIVPLRASSAAGFLPDVGAQTGELLSNSLKIFDEGSAKYESDVVIRKRHDLISKLMEPCLDILLEQLSRVVRSSARDFAHALREALPESTPTRAFYDIVTTTRKTAIEDFHKAKDNLFVGLPEGASVSITKVMAEFETALDRCVVAARKDQLERVSRVATSRIREAIEQQLIVLLRTTPKDMWEQIGALFNAAFSAATSHAFPYLSALRSTDSERSTQFLLPLLGNSENFVYEIVCQHRALLSIKLRQKFEDGFLKDEQGLRRRWTSKDDIRSLFIKSRSEALSIVPLFQRFNLREFWGEEADDIAMTCVPHGASSAESSTDFDASPVSPYTSSQAQLLKKSSVSTTQQQYHNKTAGLKDIYETGTADSADVGVEDEHKTSDDVTLESNLMTPIRPRVTNIDGLSHLPKSTFKSPASLKSKGYMGGRFGSSAGATMLPALSGPQVILLTSEQIADIERQFSLEIDGILADAQRDQERNTKATSLPPWAILVMLILGYNEIMALLRSPIVLVFSIVFGFAALIVHSLGMTKPVTAMITNSLSHAYASFQEAIAPPVDSTSTEKHVRSGSNIDTNTTNSASIPVSSIPSDTTAAGHKQIASNSADKMPTIARVESISAVHAPVATTTATATLNDADDTSENVTRQRRVVME